MSRVCRNVTKEDVRLAMYILQETAPCLEEHWGEKLILDTMTKVHEADGSLQGCG